MRSYGNATGDTPELGSEATPQEFIKNMANHLKDVRRVLKDNGSFFLNMGESIIDGENLLISTRLLLELRDKYKWFLVNEIIWKKKNPLPQGYERRLQPSYEKDISFGKETHPIIFINL